MKKKKKKKLVEKWPYAGASHNSDRSTIRCSTLDTAKETPKGYDADERSCDLRQTVSLARDFRAKRFEFISTVVQCTIISNKM